MVFNLEKPALAVLLEKLKSAFRIKNDKLSSIKISIGAVLTANKELSCHDLIQLADEQLYTANKSGKNRFEIKVLT